jgi:hypothetical protein
MVLLVGDGTKLHRPGCPATGPKTNPARWAHDKTIDEVVRECLAKKDALRPCLRCLTIEPTKAARLPAVKYATCRNGMCAKNMTRASVSVVAEGFCAACRKAFHEGYNKGGADGEARGRKEGAREAEEKMRKGAT